MADLSTKYAIEHNAKIHFFGRGQKLSFKAFLNDFSVSIQVKREADDDIAHNSTVLYDKGVSYTYNFSLSIPFSDRSEAIAGKAKVDKLVYMFSPDREERRTNNIAPGVKVLLANLINNGIGSSDVKLDGIACTADNLGVEYNTEMGFFDKKRTFFSQSYREKTNG